MSSDRIEKEIEIKAPVSRVWKALTDHTEFSTWFRVNLEGPFVPGESTRGKITHPCFEHVVMEVIVKKLEPEHYFSFTWHPYAIDPNQDYSQETPTLVEPSLPAFDLPVAQLELCALAPLQPAEDHAAREERRPAGAGDGRHVPRRRGRADRAGERGRAAEQQQRGADGQLGFLRLASPHRQDSMLRRPGGRHSRMVHAGAAPEEGPIGPGTRPPPARGAARRDPRSATR